MIKLKVFRDDYKILLDLEVFNRILSAVNTRVLVCWLHFQHFNVIYLFINQKFVLICRFCSKKCLTVQALPQQTVAMDSLPWKFGAHICLCIKTTWLNKASKRI
jgi:hypothetical protein